MLSDAKRPNATSEGKSVRKILDANGLYLWVYADGRKYWRLRYWVDSKERSLSLGVYPAVGLTEARRQRDNERSHLTDGRDPSAERRAERLRQSIAAANSFESVAREWYSRVSITWTPHHAGDVRRRLERNIFPESPRS